MEFLIDLSGRIRRVGNRDAATAVSQAGHIHFRSIQRPASDRNSADRLVIATLHPRLVSGPSVAALCYKLADLDPQRVVILIDDPVPKCWVFSSHRSALRALAALMSDSERRSEPDFREACCHTI